MEYQVAPEKRLVALVLVYMFGMFGGHRFYVGKTGSAISQLLLLMSVPIGLILMEFPSMVPFILLNAIAICVLGIWIFVDMLTILFGNFTNNKNEKLVDWT